MSAVDPSVQLLRELALLAGIALAVTLVFQRLRIPAVTGFLLTGVLIGPGGLRLVSDVEAVHLLAEIGVVVVLFMVGLEFSIPDLRALGMKPILAGALQIALTALVVAAVLGALGMHPARATFFGFLVSLSSTALLIKLLTDRAELSSPHGRVVVGILLFQDLALVPLTMLTPFLGGWAGGARAALPGPQSMMHALATLALVVVAIVVAVRVVPWVLARASRSGSREAFLAAVVLVVIGSAYLSQAAGLSLALGAFLAGLILAGSELRAQVAADVLPFRDTLSSVFFISIGMLFEPAAVGRAPGIALAATLGVVAFKALAGGAALRISGYPWFVTLPAALSLAHVGEFSFVLARSGTAAGLLSPAGEQAFLTAALFSIVLAPALVANGPRWALAGAARAATPSGLAPPPQAAAGGHVVVAGYGLNGRNVARVLRAVRIPHVVLDLAPEKVAECQGDGSTAVLGNAGQPEILRHVGVPAARALVLALSDPLAARHVVRLARDMSRNLFIVVRTRYVREIDAFYAAGANFVVPEEFETSIEIFTAVLRQFHVPPHIIDAQTGLLRRERYSLMRGIKLPGSVIAQLDEILAEGTTETVLVLQHSPAVGRRPSELAVGDERACRIVAVVRGGRAWTEFEPGFTLQVGDTFVLAGTHAGIDAAVHALEPSPAAP